MYKDTITLACAFSRVLREWLTPEEMKAINTRNIIDVNPAICHSHDFCDPNQAMIDAFTIALGREPNCGLSLPCVEDMNLMAAAWHAAKLTEFATEDSIKLRIEDEYEMSLMEFILANYHADPEQLNITDTVMLLLATNDQPHAIGMITVKRIA